MRLETLHANILWFKPSFLYDNILFNAVCGAALQYSARIPLHYCTPTPLCLCRNSDVSVLHIIMQLRVTVYSFHATLGAKVEPLPNYLIIPLPLWFILYNRKFQNGNSIASKIKRSVPRFHILDQLHVC